MSSTQYHWKELRIDIGGLQGSGQERMMVRYISEGDDPDPYRGRGLPGDSTPYDLTRKQITTGTGESIVLETWRLMPKTIYHEGDPVIGAHVDLKIPTCEAFILLYDVSNREYFETLALYHERILALKGMLPDPTPQLVAHVREQVISRYKKRHTKATPAVHPPSITLIANKIDLP
ncbi:Hypothetical protein D9617_22g066790 [Elsinoe fawcettii]|nr:Hypothetical protein D9617_22g066790 [Elsinoe fawcettii]